MKKKQKPRHVSLAEASFGCHGYSAPRNATKTAIHYLKTRDSSGQHISNLYREQSLKRQQAYEKVALRISLSRTP